MGKRAYATHEKIQMSIRIRAACFLHFLFIDIYYSIHQGSKRHLHSQADQGQCCPQIAYRPFSCVAHHMTVFSNLSLTITYLLAQESLVYNYVKAITVKYFNLAVTLCWHYLLSKQKQPK